MIAALGTNRMPENLSTTFGDQYRKTPKGLALVAAFIVSLISALITGILAALAATYLYDGGNSKGDDFGVAIGGLCALGTFTFVVLFTWLQKVHHPISSRTPAQALFACLTIPVIITLLALSEIDGNDVQFLLADWVAIALFSFAAWMVCRRWYDRSEATLW